jgi:endonuclease/exonuclease/phosphatase family metal-dependent hydrolase
MKLIILLLACLSFQANSTEISLTTYNLGLAHTFIPFAEERLAPLVKNLKSHDTDVLCLQEVWKKSDQKKLKRSLKGIYPHLYKTKIKNYRTGRRPTCKIKDIFGEGKFISCMQNSCGDLDGDEFTDCLINKCGEPLEDLKTTNRLCASALMAQVGKSPIASIVTLLNPLRRAGQFSYKGSNGLMLFSKYPIKEKRYIDFKEISTLSRRGALSVVLDVKGKELQVMCTHLSADLTQTVPYTGIFKNWAEENKEQFSRLLQTANHKLYPTALIGDFNCGFADRLAGLSGELESSCQQAIDWSYSDFLSEELEECTFCGDNLLNDADQENEAIDHIFLKGMTPISGKVVFKDEVYILRDRSQQRTSLSDHYGLKVRASF